MAEFAYNNALNTSTGVSPFFANKGYNPNLMIHPEYELASAQAHQYVTDLTQLHANLKNAIFNAQERTQVQTDWLRSAPSDIQIGSQVFIKAEFFRITRPSKKLSEKFLEPFKVIAKPGSLSYTLKLPNSMHAVHPVFHISMLEPATPNSFEGRTLPALPPVIIQDEENYEISEILDSRIDGCRRKSCNIKYLVRFLGYEGTMDEYDWVYTMDLNAPDLMDEFHPRYPDKPGP